MTKDGTQKKKKGGVRKADENDEDGKLIHTTFRMYEVPSKVPGVEDTPEWSRGLVYTVEGNTVKNFTVLNLKWNPTCTVSKHMK